MKGVPTVRRSGGAGEAVSAMRAIEAEDGGGVVRGYASLFNRTDLSGDRIEPGAFAATLKARGAGGIRMLWQHDPAEPIGRWTAMREDATGLYVEGRLSVETRRGRDVFELLRAGAVDGLSIGFRTKRAVAERGRAIRRLLEIDLWEVSIVTFPMQELARVRQVRGTPRALLERFVEGAKRMAGPRAVPAS